MDTPHLNAFLAVVDMGSFTQAAARLGLSQPTVTTRIKSLEQGLDTLLLERRPGRIRPTAAGVELLPYAREIVALTERARQSISSGGQPHGTVDVGTEESLTTYRLLPVIEYLYRRYPKVQISMHATATEDPVAQVRDGRLDCAFFVGSIGSHSPEDGLESQVLCPEPLVLVGGAGHLLVGQERPSIEELRSSTLIRADRAEYHRHFERAIGLRAAAPRPRILELDSVDAAKRSVELGLGLALLPRIAVARDLAAGRLLPVAWTPPFSAFTQVVRRRDSASNAALNALLTAAVEVMRQAHESEGEPEPRPEPRPEPVARPEPRERRMAATG
ncbi:LysR family transcriptional regulator [Streptomyces triticirhizae]|uniref:LysR family transcriptional regulator n=1 Tax=Streptomyces triticirhizae TaxID=2483353 RepID=A0A3M2LU37_9ACTN|nr:LysR family transcriptional regulator [Streptomyces triticirhizae]RMI40626.1 LysR family transcriptional regulator [Streptomyces triticirhizae]